MLELRKGLRPSENINLNKNLEINPINIMLAPDEQLYQVSGHLVTD
jgi:hypothetical protein